MALSEYHSLKDQDDFDYPWTTLYRTRVKLCNYWQKFEISIGGEELDNLEIAFVSWKSKVQAKSERAAQLLGPIGEHLRGPIVYELICSCSLERVAKYEGETEYELSSILAFIRSIYFMSRMAINKNTDRQIIECRASIKEGINYRCELAADVALGRLERLQDEKSGKGR